MPIKSRGFGGHGKPPRHTRFRKGQSGNPGGRPGRPSTERAKALTLREAYRRITVKEGDRAVALPAAGHAAAGAADPPRP